MLKIKTLILALTVISFFMPAQVLDNALAGPAQITAPPSNAALPKPSVNLANLPLYFIPNQGQAPDTRIKFYCTFGSNLVYFTPQGIILILIKRKVRIRLRVKE